MLLINDTAHQEIIRQLSAKEGRRLHFTNGTYAYDAKMIVPTTLAAFEYLSDQTGNEEDDFVIAVNSDVSMKAIMDQKKASAEEREALEDQETRAMKGAIPLQKAHPDRSVIVLYYDEQTPTALYDSLAESGEFDMKSLHKWGYGTDPNAPKIEGAYNFSTVYGFPLPNDERPVCWDITGYEDQSSAVKVVKLDKYMPSDLEQAGYPPPRRSF